MNRIKAFTLMEVMVALVISSVVISMASMLFLSIKRDVVKEKETQEEGQKILRLQTLLEKDFAGAGRITYKGGELQVDNKGKERKRYIFLNDYVVRSDSYRIDTFYFRVENIEYRYLLDESPLVSFFSFSISMQGRKDRYFKFTKQYPQLVLFNKTQKIEH